MRKSRLTEEQIINVLQGWGAGARIADWVRPLGASEQTLYRWKKYGGLQVNEAKQLRALKKRLGNSSGSSLIRR